ncbi:hypothetical protein NVS55_20220 [Myxococcus stipitatus]|uniref:beta-ketoacyl synthase N-terminal-like domain-containing protein n=1 Tax=Myxococcus stipitatus TaxID=83455 RepID=UPI003144EB08
MTAAAIRAGITRMSMHPYIVDRAGEPLRVAPIQYLDDLLSRTSRLVDIGGPALQEICDLLAPLLSRRTPIGLYLGLPELRPGFTEADVAITAKALGCIIKNAEVRSLPLGHCGGAMAIQKACEDIVARRFELCIAGGVDSYLHDKTLAWLDRNGQLQSSRRRSGMVPGEAAAFCLLCSPRVARALGLSPFIALSGMHTAIEHHGIKKQSVCLGEGLAAAIMASTHGVPVDAVYCDLNGERYRNEEWGMASLRLSEVVVDPSRYVTPASLLGDVGAASGPLFAVLAHESLRRGYMRGGRVLGWTSAEAGHRTALVFERFIQEGRHPGGRS